jgi:protein subunit release factor B
LDGEEARSTVLDLLHAERKRQEFLAEGRQVPESEESVRRYTMRPQQSAKDQRTGVETHNLRELWKGAIDEFLTAGLEREEDP